MREGALRGKQIDESVNLTNHTVLLLLQNCYNVPEKKCDYVTKERCKQVPYQDCKQVPKKDCRQVHKKVPKQVRKTVCDDDQPGSSRLSSSRRSGSVHY